MELIMSKALCRQIIKCKPKRLITSLALSFTMVLGITACGDPGTQKSSSDTANSSGEKVVLRLSHFLPAPAAMNTKVFEPWAKKIEEESNGRLEIEIYPGSTLSKAGSTYEAATKGVIDIGVQLQGYTSGRFPLSQIAELPGLSNSSAQMSCLMQSLYDDGTLAEEYQDSHVLALYGLGPGVLHTTNKAISTPDDMQGMRIRRPSSVAGDLIESMGGSPVGLPANDIYTSLQRGVIDGLSLPWDGVPDFRLNELVKYHTNIPLYSSAFVVNMNQQKYDSLPEDLKKILDDNSGMKLANLVGTVISEMDTKALKAAKDAGDTIVEVPDPLNDPEWAAPLSAGTEKYLASVRASGLDADSVYERVKEVSSVCKSNNSLSK